MGGLLGVLGRIVLPVLGRLGKGKATITGAVAVIAGATGKAIAPHVLTDANLVGALHEVAGIVEALGTVVAAFGFGRKAGVAHAEAQGGPNG